MFDLRIKDVMERKKLLRAARDMTVGEAARMMSKKHVGAVMVVEGKRLVGIFTERDALFRVIAEKRDPETTHLEEVMTPAPLTIAPEDSFGHALHVMFEKGFRHLPVIRNGEPIGMVTSRHALDPDLEEFIPEAKRREHFELGHD